MITISKKEYYDLSIAEETLNRLEYGGVDNWEWYGEALGDDMEEFEEKLWNEIMGKESKFKKEYCDTCKHYFYKKNIIGGITKCLIKKKFLMSFKKNKACKAYEKVEEK